MKYRGRPTLSDLLISNTQGQILRLGKRIMIEQPLLGIIQACVDKYEIRGADESALMDRMEKIWCERELLSLLESGEMEIAGFQNGEPLWKATEKGKAIARKLFGDQ